MGKRRRRGPEEEVEELPKKPVTQKVKEQIEKWALEAVEAYNLLLFDVEVSSKWKIEVYVDNEAGGEPGKGVTIDDCAKVSRFMEELLDLSEEVPERYTIEVSSPGVERELSKPRHFQHVVGRSVRLVLREAVDGENVFEGILVGFEDPVIQVDVEGHRHEFRFCELAKARLTYDFSGVTEG